MAMAAQLLLKPGALPAPSRLASLPPWMADGGHGSRVLDDLASSKGARNRSFCCLTKAARSSNLAARSRSLSSLCPFPQRSLIKGHVNGNRFPFALLSNDTGSAELTSDAHEGDGSSFHPFALQLSSDLRLYQYEPFGTWLAALFLAMAITIFPFFQPGTSTAMAASITPPSQIHSPLEPVSSLFLLSDAGAPEGSSRFVIDAAKVLSESKLQRLREDLETLEQDTGWRVRVLTRGSGTPSPTREELRALWNPDEKTIIVLEDISSPNVLNFNSGDSVRTKLPRQFFIELQSRYGNQFFVADEGQAQVLLQTAGALSECLRRSEGCVKVPGLVDELYFLTLITSIAGGAVFGFAARTPPAGRIDSSWQWIVIFSPLWGILFLSFGILPIVSRTSDVIPLAKNVLGFLGGAAAFYLTPIFGESPISRDR